MFLRNTNIIDQFAYKISPAAAPLPTVCRYFSFLALYIKTAVSHTSMDPFIAKVLRPFVKAVLGKAEVPKYMSAHQTKVWNTSIFLAAVIFLLPYPQSA